MKLDFDWPNEGDPDYGERITEIIQSPAAIHFTSSLKVALDDLGHKLSDFDLWAVSTWLLSQQFEFLKATLEAEEQEAH